MRAGNTYGFAAKGIHKVLRGLGQVCFLKEPLPPSLLGSGLRASMEIQTKRSYKF